ncbi:MAG: universal stress protein [Cyanobacteria bacterium]|nr:universal stress protein [Cyanobacteriota bacterium]
MQSLSILLGLSGSEESKSAAEIAYAIALKCNGRICAQHIVDEKSLWEILRSGKPGLIGSGPYIDAYEKGCEGLTRLGNALLEKFEAVYQGRSVPVETLIERGSPIELICERAKDHNLVIVGHEKRDQQNKSRSHSNFLRHAVAEGLAHECPRPLLVVQESIQSWNSMTVLISVDHVNFTFIKACLDMAKLLRVPPKVVVLTGGVHEEPPEQLLSDLKAADPDIGAVPVAVRVFTGLTAEDGFSLRHPDELHLDWAPEPDTLLVIPTRNLGSERLTIFDSTPDLFVRFLNLPSLMMWPEEYKMVGGIETHNYARAESSA